MILDKEYDFNNLWNNIIDKIKEIEERKELFDDDIDNNERKTNLSGDLDDKDII